MIVLVLGIVVVVAVVVALVALRRPRHDTGVSRFQRHIDALSPEARRAVIDRAQQHPGGRREQRGS